jgi:hypothetical protein
MSNKISVLNETPVRPGEFPLYILVYLGCLDKLHSPIKFFLLFFLDLHCFSVRVCVKQSLDIPTDVLRS